MRRHENMHVNNVMSLSTSVWEDFVLLLGRHDTRETVGTLLHLCMCSERALQSGIKASIN